MTAASADAHARILNVEDNSPARFLKSRILERAGFQVVEAVTAEDAVRTAADDRLKLVLLDLHLPDGDGFEVCERIKASRPDLPVVMITSTYASSQGRTDGLASGADAYLVEPVGADRLVRVIRQFLEPGTPTGADLDAWIVTDDTGEILEISGPGHRLLNLSARGALGRTLLPFFDGDRQQLSVDLRRACAGEVVARSALLRPRDRRPFPVRLRLVVEAPTDLHRTRVRWGVEPETPSGN
jgi:CheY-like chemotaxis protein